MACLTSYKKCWRKKSIHLSYAQYLVQEFCSWWECFPVATSHGIVTCDLCRSIKDIHRTVWLAITPLQDHRCLYVPLRSGYTNAAVMMCRGAVLQISLIKASMSPRLRKRQRPIVVVPLLSSTLIPCGRCLQCPCDASCMGEMVSLSDDKVPIISGAMNGTGGLGVCHCAMSVPVPGEIVGPKSG